MNTCSEKESKSWWRGGERLPEKEEAKPVVDPWECDICHEECTLFFPLLYNGKQICPLCTPKAVFDPFPGIDFSKFE